MKNKGVKKVLKNAALNTATTSAHRSCTFFFYQPKLPKAVKRLRKF